MGQHNKHKYNISLGSAHSILNVSDKEEFHFFHIILFYLENQTTTFSIETAVKSTEQRLSNNRSKKYIDS